MHFRALYKLFGAVGRAQSRAAKKHIKPNKNKRFSGSFPRHHSGAVVLLRRYAV